MSELAERFTQALHELERTRDPGVMVPLFADDAELRRAPRAAVYHGADGARTFWSEYLDAFQSVQTTFDAVTTSAERVVLEWRSNATSKQGRPIQYDGCSVLEGTHGRVARFRTYYDATSAGMGGPARTAAE